MYGSTLRGNFDIDSDIDMLIVKDTHKRRVDRIKDVLLSVDYNAPFEPIVYTPNELNYRKKLGDNFILEVLKQGKILYERRN